MIRAAQLAESAAVADRMAREADLAGDWLLAAEWCDAADRLRAREGAELAELA